MKLKDACSLKESYGKTREHIKKQRYHFVDYGLYSQSCNFSSSHIRIWELDHKEGWALKNQYFWTEVLEKTLESPLDCKEIKQVNSKGNKSWIFIGKSDAETEAPTLWPPDVKSWLIGKVPDAGKDWGQKEKRMAEDEIVGWHHLLNGHECEQTPWACEGQGSLACYNPWGCKELMWLSSWPATCSSYMQLVHMLVLLPPLNLL